MWRLSNFHSGPYRCKSSIFLRATMNSALPTPDGSFPSREKYPGGVPILDSPGEINRSQPRALPFNSEPTTNGGGGQPGIGASNVPAGPKE
jgi:hypothetical protein